MPEDKPDSAWDITKQLVETERGRRLAVVLGGGRGSFIPAPGPQTGGWNCSRRDGIDMIKRWKRNHPKGKFVDSKSDLFKINAEETEAVLGKTVHICRASNDILTQGYSAGTTCPMMTRCTPRTTLPLCST